MQKLQNIAIFNLFLQYKTAIKNEKGRTSENYFRLFI